TFKTPSNPLPSDPTKVPPVYPFTFSVHSGTTVPTNITPSVLQAPSGTVVTINGTGLTGVFGVSFNGYPGEIVGTPTDTAVQVKVPKITENVTLPNGNTTTYPGRTGKIGVRNASGINYSSADFTIGESTATKVAFGQQPTSGLAKA